MLAHFRSGDYRIQWEVTMNRIVYIGIDVHSTNFTFCSLEPNFRGEDKIFGVAQTAPGYRSVLKYIEQIRKALPYDADIVCGYEAGCFGYALQRQLSERSIRCQILAPTTMYSEKGQRRKTDRRDAKMIAENLANGTFSPVYVPTREDEEVKDYIRMRDDHRKALKKIKQQINAFCLRHGHRYPGKSKWTVAHTKWLKGLELDHLDRETLDEYYQSYEYHVDRIEGFDRRIEELASKEAYAEQVKKLRCFLGIETVTAVALIVESGDFKRFRKGNIYAAYLGLVPGENSSGDNYRQGGMTKAGNKHLRRLLTEASQSICKGTIGHKSKALKARQRGNAPEVIAYADRANERLRRKYYRMVNRGKDRNTAVAAVSRELACFVWGMMTGNTQAALG